MSNVIHATDANFHDAIKTGKPVLIDFWATWCGPCKQVAPVIDAIAAERDDITVIKVDVDQAPALAQSYRVQGVPALVVLNSNGTVATHNTGAQPKAAILSNIAKAR